VVPREELEIISMPQGSNFQDEPHAVNEVSPPVVSDPELSEQDEHGPEDTDPADNNEEAGDKQ
jgi:hypothetical protein